MQIELCFNIPSAPVSRISSLDWRRKLASISEGALPNWFFGRDDEGNRLTDFPGIRFLGGQRALRIAAFGKEPSDQLASLMPTLFKLMNRAAGVAVPVRLNEYSVAAIPSYQRLYHVSLPILTRRGDRRERYADTADPLKRKELVRKRLVHGLVRQASHFGLDFPPDDEIDLLECGAYRAKRAHDGFGYGVQYAVIGMPIDLKGIWQTGLLLSHGHGAVTPYRKRETQNDDVRQAA